MSEATQPVLETLTLQLLEDLSFTAELKSTGETFVNQDCNQLAELIEEVANKHLQNFIASCFSFDPPSND